MPGLPFCNVDQAAISIGVELSETKNSNSLWKLELLRAVHPSPVPTPFDVSDKILFP